MIEHFSKFYNYLHVSWLKLGILLLLVLTCFALYTIWQQSPPALADSYECSDLEFIFARGSGEALGSPSATAWEAENRNQLASSGLSYHFYELGSAKQGEYQYPASAVSGSLGGFVNLLGAFISSGESFTFGRSVAQGIGELKAYTQKISKLCPKTKFVLGGYSQGAMIISKTLPDLDAKKILYAATFGDPKLYLPEGNSHTMGIFPKVPDACMGKNLSPYRAHVPDCYAYEGVLGSQRPYQPEVYAGKIGTWCNDDDIMCSSGSSISDHGEYVANNFYQAAARIIRSRIRIAFPNASGSLGFSFNKPTSHDVAIIIDSTESMQPLIDQYKTEAKRLARQVIQGNGRVALFEYRDLSDPFETKMHCNFTCTYDDFSAKIDAIEADGGGDASESALSAVMTALNSLNWMLGATKSAVILTDARYLSPDRDGVTLEDVTKRSLEIDPVNVYVVTNNHSPSIRELHEELAEATGGQVFDIDTELELSTETILGRPVAQLALMEYRGNVGEEFRFDASSSYSPDGSELSFDWDLDGDNKFELENQGAVVTKRYDKDFSGFIQVRVRSIDGVSSTMSAKLTVTNSQPQLATITDLKHVIRDDRSAQVSFKTNASKVLLVLNDAVLGFTELYQNSGRFTLNDVTDHLRLTLIPYGKDGQRGIPAQLDLRTTYPSAPDSAAHLLYNPSLSAGYLETTWRI